MDLGGIFMFVWAKAWKEFTILGVNQYLFSISY